MSTGHHEIHAFTPLPPASGWSWQKLVLIILFAFTTHLAFVFVLGAKKTVPPRPVTNVPLFRLADNPSELIRLTDPTLFVLPHANEFAPADWAQPPVVTAPSFRWTEPPPFLPPATDMLGAVFQTFMQTNRFVPQPLSFKPAPQLILPTLAIPSLLPQQSTWQLSGAIASRRLLSELTVPTLALNDILSPSRVQVLVDQAGNVVSAVLLESSGDNETDLTALALSRTLRLAPAVKLGFGEIIFNWHTVPVSAP